MYFIDMSEMFSCCFGTKNINLSNFNTQNVTDMNNMFQQCNKLININLSSFNTQNTRENLTLLIIQIFKFLNIIFYI